MGPEENDDYQDWLDETGLEDTSENKGWYDCEEDERYDYIQNNPDWWEKF